MKGITLIGMPGVGKSTVCKLLASELQWNFIDVDELIYQLRGISHDEFLKVHGEEALKNLEEKLTLEQNLINSVFSPPGSIIFSKKAMNKIKDETKVFYLKSSLDKIIKQLGDKIDKNGIIGLAENGIEGVYLEREPIYNSYADEIINAEELDAERICRLIIEDINV